MFFKSKSFDPDTFEKQLREISKDISKNERQLKSMQLNVSSYRRVIPMYTVSLYILVIAYFYLRGLLHEQKAILVLIAYPFVVFLLYKGAIYLSNYLMNWKKLTIDKLKQRHEEKLAVLKEKTNFERTKELLVRFSDGEDIKELEKEIKKANLKKEEYIQKLANEQRDMKNLGQRKGKYGKLYDSLFNLMMGEDEMGADKRYALICHNCLQHNGLAPPGQAPNEVRYICPKCGWVNGDQKEGQSPLLLPKIQDLKDDVEVDPAKDDHSSRSDNTSDASSK